jgi:hypothetical protein
MRMGRRGTSRNVEERRGTSRNDVEGRRGTSRDVEGNAVVGEINVFNCFDLFVCKNYVILIK